MRIGIDLMGSDNSPLILFKAVLEAAEEFGSSTTLLVLATGSLIDELRMQYQAKLASSHLAPIEFYKVAEAIAMTDEPLTAVRRKNGSSLMEGIRLIKKKQLDALVSAGNTGALIASATLHLPKLPGIKRPALLALLPTIKDSVAVLDVGGNVSCQAHHLVQFARLGAAYQRCIKGIEKPTVGLLNIGVEPKKGSSSIRQAYEALMQANDSNHPTSFEMKFLGNVEGRELFLGNIDVLVTDGFTGNVLLKTTEGVSSFIMEYLHEKLPETSVGHLKEVFAALKRHFSYDQYPGAFLCGIDGIVIKCHGTATPQAIVNSIKGAVKLVEGHVVSRLKTQLASSHQA